MSHNQPRSEHRVRTNLQSHYTDSFTVPRHTVPRHIVPPRHTVPRHIAARRVGFKGTAQLELAANHQEAARSPTVELQGKLDLIVSIESQGQDHSSPPSMFIYCSGVKSGWDVSQILCMI